MTHLARLKRGFQSTGYIKERKGSKQRHTTFVAKGRLHSINFIVGELVVLIGHSVCSHECCRLTGIQMTVVDILVSQTVNVLNAGSTEFVYRFGYGIAAFHSREKRLVLLLQFRAKSQQRLESFARLLQPFFHSLEAQRPGIAIAMERLVAISSFENPSPFQVETRIELISHADTPMNLDQLVGHFMQKVANPRLG